MGLFDAIVGGGLRLYDRMNDRASLPSNKRAFLETFVDGSSAPITEKELKDDEKKALLELIQRKYSNPEFKHSLSKYKEYLEEMMDNHQKAVKTKNKDKYLNPDFESTYKADLEAIKAFEQGKLTPQFLQLAQNAPDRPRNLGIREAEYRDNKVDRRHFNIKPNIQYEDYPEGSAFGARSVFGKPTPMGSLSTLLGRFNYEIDPRTGQLIVKDRYDFNNATSVFTGQAIQPQGISEATLVGTPDGGTGLYQMLREYAGANLPPDSKRGREVRINLMQTGLEPTIK